MVSRPASGPGAAPAAPPPPAPALSERNARWARVLAERGAVDPTALPTALERIARFGALAVQLEAMADALGRTPGIGLAAARSARAYAEGASAAALDLLDAEARLFRLRREHLAAASDLGREAAAREAEAAVELGAEAAAGRRALARRGGGPAVNAALQPGRLHVDLVLLCALWAAGFELGGRWTADVEERAAADLPPGLRAELAAFPLPLSPVSVLGRWMVLSGPLHQPRRDLAAGERLCAARLRALRAAVQARVIARQSPRPTRSSP